MPVRNVPPVAAAVCARSGRCSGLGVGLNAINATASRIRIGTTASNTLLGRANSSTPPATAPLLAAQLAAVAPRAADRAEDEPDRVRDIGHHGRVADREQGRERDQRP